MSDPEAGAVELSGLDLRYGGTVVAVDRVSLRVPRHEIMALVGPSGCGKTSLLRAIAGFEAPDSGTLQIDGRCVAGNGTWVPPEARQVGMVFQQGALFPHMTVRRNVLYGVRKLPDARQRAEQALDRVGLAGLAERYPDQLSGGQQQLVALARALAPAPRVVLLDEPFASLDAGRRERLREEVREVLGQARMTAILVTHDQEEALSLADSVAVMRGGRILQVGTPEEIYDRPASIEVAEFVGGGQLLVCSVLGGQLVTELGTLSTDAPDGGARLLVRPEQIVIHAGERVGPATGELVRRSYFGHDQLNEVRLVRSGVMLRVRTLESQELRCGARVQAALRPGTYRLYHDNGASYGVTA